MAQRNGFDMSQTGVLALQPGTLSMLPVAVEDKSGRQALAVMACKQAMVHEYFFLEKSLIVHVLTALPAENTRLTALAT